jgi:hypothetical protein
MRQLASLFLCFLFTVTLLWSTTDSAHAVGYNFNALSGNDNPITDLDGQDNWTTQGFGVNGVPDLSRIMGVTATLGFDGTPALRFQEQGPGVGADASRLNDGAFSIPTFDGSETEAFIQADFGFGAWGNQFALGYDTNADSIIRRSTPNEIGPRLSIGCFEQAGVSVTNAAGITTKVPVSNVNAGCTEWVRLRLVMDFTANGGQGSGDVYFKNLTNGDTCLQPVTGLQGINLGLNPGSGDASDPVNWNGMWGHMEGATNELDNIRVETSIPTITKLTNHTSFMFSSTRPKINDSGDVVWVEVNYNNWNAMIMNVYLLPHGEATPINLTIDTNELAEAPQINNNGDVVWYQHVTDNYSGNTSKGNVYLLPHGETVPINLTDHLTGTTQAKLPQINDNGDVIYALIEPDPVSNYVKVNLYLIKGATSGSPATPESLSDTTFIDSVSYQINNNGKVVWTQNYMQEAYLYDGTGRTQLVDLGNTGKVESVHINNNGDVGWGIRNYSGGYAATVRDIYLLPDGVAVPIKLGDDVLDYQTVQMDINDNGDVVWRQNTSSGYKISLYDGTNTSDLSAPASNGFSQVALQINNIGNVIWLQHNPPIYDQIYYDGIGVAASNRARSPQINNQGDLVWHQTEYVNSRGNVTNNIHLATFNHPPVALCKSATVYLGASGNTSIIPADVDNGSADPDDCDTLTLSVSPSSFNCDDVGPNTVTLTVTDDSGKSDSCTTTVTVVDSTSPEISCPANISVDNDDGVCGAIVNYIDPVGTDNCPGTTTAQTAGLGSGAVFPVGTTTETYTVTGATGIPVSCSFTVTVTDAEDPVVIANLVPVKVKKKHGCFRVEFSASDNCAVADLSALLNGRSVTNGQLVELKKKKRQRVKDDDDSSSGGKRHRCGDVRFEGTEFILEVTATDEDGNSGTATDSHIFESGSSDDGSSSGHKHHHHGSDDDSRSGHGKKK